MTAGDTLENALADVRRRRADLEAQYEHVAAELAKLRMAEKSLAAIVEGAEAAALVPGPAPDPVAGASARASGRGSRGPRANSAKGRLKALIEGAGPGGLSQAEIARRLPDVAPATLNAYLSTMATSGEAVRRGDFYAPGTIARPGAGDGDGSGDGEPGEGSEAEDADA